MNGNYIILLASIFFELTNNESNFDICSNMSFANDCLNEVRPQITKEDKIIIFNHQIQSQFINDLILNLLLLSNLTNNLISDFFPYIISRNLYLNNPKIELLLQKLAKDGFLKLDPFDDASKSGIITLLTNDFKITPQINEKTLNFVSISILFTKSELNFEIYAEDEPDKLIQSINNSGIVFENYTLSNPKLSKKLKLKMFNKKFILFLDDENQAEEGDCLNTDRDEKIGNLFNYEDMDFSSSYIDLSDLCLRALIGSGTYGNVYLVENKEINKQFAAKILKDSIKEIPVQFLSELKVLQSLRFPSIVKFIGFCDRNFNNEDYPTIITEYLKNGSLFDFLKDVFEGTKKLDNTKRMMILIGIALGIEYLHNHEIIHRDLKLKDILLDDELNPKICDFGDSNILILHLFKSNSKCE